VDSAGLSKMYERSKKKNKKIIPQKIKLKRKPCTKETKEKKERRVTGRERDLAFCFTLFFAF
jgi:hypothetical protein